MELLRIPSRVVSDLTEGIRIALNRLMPLFGAVWLVTLFAGLATASLPLLWIAATLGLLVLLDAFAD